MALSAKLALRQSQAMVLTPQLLQAIKLLQMPNLELTQFIENELASNPLLDRAEEREEPSLEQADAEATGFAEAPAEPGDWAREALERMQAISPPISAPRSKTPSTRTAPRQPPSPRRPTSLSANAWTGVGAGPDTGDAPDLEAYVAESISLRDHLERQAAILLPDPAERMIGAALIDGLDEAGYFVGSLAEIAEQLGADVEQVERVLERMQTLEPTGVFARSLPECLALQLKERDRFDPAMQALIENLPALAPAGFSRCCAGSAGSTTRICATCSPRSGGSSPSPDAPSATRRQRRRFPTSMSPRRRISAGGSNSIPEPCRACSSTRSMRPRSDAARGATRTANMSPPNCSRPTG